MVDDRDDVSQALAGTGAGRDDIGLATGRDGDGIDLVSIELERRTRVTSVPLAPEYPRALAMKRALAYKIIDAAAGLIGRVEL
jgi:hypothetical protein